MKTAVYQSYRTQAVPAWVDRCMQSARAWADAERFLTNVGVLSPVVAHDIRSGLNTFARKYAALHGAPIHAINLGGSLCGKHVEGNVLDNHDYDAIVDVIECTRGAIFTNGARA